MDSMSRSIPAAISEPGGPSGRSRLVRVAAAGLALSGLAVAAWLVLARRGSPPVDMESIRSAIEARRYVEAEAALVRRLEGDPDDAAWLMLGDLRAKAGRDDEALPAFERVRGPGPSYSRARTRAAEIFLRRRDASRAEQALRDAAKGDPEAIDARRRLADLLALEGRDDEGRTVLRELYRIVPDPRDLVTMVRLALPDTVGQDEANKLGPFLARTPDDPILRRARGLVLLRAGKPAEARPDLEAAGPAFEDDPVGRIALAESRLASRDLDAIEAALGFEPTPKRLRADWWRMKGQVEEARGRTSLAIDDYRKALEENPDDRAALDRLARALAGRGEDNAARPLLERSEAVRARRAAIAEGLERCLRTGPDPGAFEQLARLCRDSGLQAEARAWAEQAIRLEPGRTSTQALLASIAEPEAAPDPASSRLKVTVGPTRSTGDAPESVGRGPLRFEDVAEKAGLAYRYNPYPTGNLSLADTMGGGVGLIDFDEDGRLDVYFVGGCRLPIEPGEDPTPNKLFRNKGDGTFEDVTARAGVAGHGYGMGCSVGDYDNDGHDDLFVTGLDRTILYRNRGDGTFEDVTTRAGVGSSRWTTASGFGDLDGDGDIDLVAVAYVEIDPRDVPECLDPTGKPYHCTPGRFRPQPDHLFRNNGDGTFTDVSKGANFEADRGFGLGLAIADVDDDGKLDLFVANDTAPNFLFMNRGGLKFEEVGVTAGAAYNADGRATASMGVVADDLDGDGRLDLLHVNFLDEPNTLLRNLGGGQFEDIAVGAGLDATGRTTTGFGAVALDAENDGRLDLFIANGHVDHRPWAHRPMAQRPTLYRSKSPGRFELAPPSIGPYFAGDVVGRGTAAGDLDNDGRVDLVVVHREAPAAVLRNASEGGHWVGLRLVGERSGKTPVGARVTCRAGGRTSARWLTGGTSYLSSNDPRLFFGLGPVRTIERLEVRWPSGLVQGWSNVAANRFLELREGHAPVDDPRMLDADRRP